MPHGACRMASAGGGGCSPWCRALGMWFGGVEMDVDQHVVTSSSRSSIIIIIITTTWELFALNCPPPHSTIRTISTVLFCSSLRPSGPRGPRALRLFHRGWGASRWPRLGRPSDVWNTELFRRNEPSRAKPPERASSTANEDENTRSRSTEPDR